MFEDFELTAEQGGLKSIRKPNEKMFLITRGCACHNANRAASMNERIVRASDFHKRDDLCPRKNVVRLMGHF